MKRKSLIKGNDLLSASKNLMAALLCILFSAQISAQDITVSATIDTAKLLIGQQRNLKFNVSASKNIQFSFPQLKDSIGRIEIISVSKIDTLANNSNQISLQQNLVVTSWDTGFVPVQPIPVYYKKPNDTTRYTEESKAFLLTVNTVPVDTTKAIKDIKPPIEVPWTLADFLPYIIGALLGVGLVFLILYYVRKSKFKSGEIVPRIPSKPAHEIALAALYQLKEEKIWQQGNLKLYHTRLTDIIRTYIEVRYKTPAMEFTSDEILSSTEMKNLNQDAFSKLKFMLELADTVKFAKALPVASENEMSMSYAFDFVNETKQQPVAVTEVKPATT